MIVASGWSFIIQTNKQTNPKKNEKKKKKNLKFLILIFKKKITIAIKTRFRRLKIGSRNPKKIDFLFDFLGFLNFWFIFFLFLEIWRFRLSG
jgi:ABC-type phosphate/phosphonate transport system permease subunit